MLLCLLPALQTSAQNGDPDSTFGGIGISRLSIDNCGAGYEHMQVDAQGNIYLAGTIQAMPCQLNSTCTVGKMRHDGVIDSTYAYDGGIDVNFCTSDDEVTDLVLDHNTGEVYVLGHEEFGLDPFAPDPQMVIFRLTPNGLLDVSFGNNAGLNLDVVQAPGVAEAHQLHLLPDGKLLATCRAGSGFYFVRYLHNGERDSTFHGNGEYLSALPNAAQPVGDMVVANNRIYIAARQSFYQYAYVYCFAMDGGLDSTYGVNGRATYNPGAGYAVDPRDITLASDGGIVVAGSKYTSPGNYDICLAFKFDPTGQIDAQFGTGGEVIYAPMPNDDTRFCSIETLSDGRLACTGFKLSNYLYYRYCCLMLGPNGGLVYPWGPGSYVATSFMGWNSNQVASLGAVIGVDSLQRVVVAGIAASQVPGRYFDAAIVRYTNDGSYFVVDVQEPEAPHQQGFLTPNPASPGSQVQLSTSVACGASWALFDSWGRVVSTGSIHDVGPPRIHLPNGSANGLHHLRVEGVPGTFQVLVE